MIIKCNIFLLKFTNGDQEQYTPEQNVLRELGKLDKQADFTEEEIRCPYWFLSEDIVAIRPAIDDEGDLTKQSVVELRNGSGDYLKIDVPYEKLVEIWINDGHKSVDLSENS